MKKIIILLAIIFIFISCDNNDDSNQTTNPLNCDIPINITSLENEYGCINTKNEMEINLINDFTIIKEQSTYDNLITGTCQPDIDFNTYDLVIGNQNPGNGNDSITYELIKNCQTNNLEFKVTFNQNDTEPVPFFTYHALIPKIQEGQELNVIIEINF